MFFLRNCNRLNVQTMLFAICHFVGKKSNILTEGKRGLTLHFDSEIVIVHKEHQSQTHFKMVGRTIAHAMSFFFNCVIRKERSDLFDRKVNHIS